MSVKQIIQQKLLQTRNDKNIAIYIQDFIGNNCCEKCYQHSEEPLTYVMSFNKSKGTYEFKDLPGANYVLKKFCKKCTMGKASSAPIYIEIFYPINPSLYSNDKTWY